MKDIEGYEGLYQVSEDGRVYSVRRGKCLSPCLDSYGYPMVVLCSNRVRKTTRIHRLVAQAFIPNPYDKPQVNHIDGDKTNNLVSNLEWVTSDENVLHAVQSGLIRSGVDHGSARLDDDVVRRIKIMRRDTGLGAIRIKRALGLGVHVHTIHKIISCQTWRHVAVDP